MLNNKKEWIQVLGTDDLHKYLRKYGIELDPQFEHAIGQQTKKPWNKFVSTENKHLAVPDAIDFLDHLLKYDHVDRYTTIEAMAHPYFDPIRNRNILCSNGSC